MDDFNKNTGKTDPKNKDFNDKSESSPQIEHFDYYIHIEVNGEDLFAAHIKDPRSAVRSLVSELYKDKEAINRALGKENVLWHK